MDGTSWAYQTALLAILNAVLLTATRRQAYQRPGCLAGIDRHHHPGPGGHPGGTLSTLLSAWFLIDTLELVYLLVSLKPHHDLGKLVTSFALRYAGILVASDLDWNGILQPIRIPIFLAAMLRLGVLPFWSYWGDFSALTGLGTMMQAVRVLSALTPLARLEAG